MYIEYREPIWIYPIFLAGSIFLNFLAADNFPLLFSTQKRIILPDMVEVDIELAPVEEEIILTQSRIQMEKEGELKAEDIDLSKLLAQKMPLPKLDGQTDFLASEAKTVVLTKLPEQQSPVQKVVDRSGEFKDEAPLDLSETVDLDSASSADYAHFENVYVAIPKKNDIDHLTDGSFPANVVEDKGDNFKKQEYAALPVLSFEASSADRLIDAAALRAAIIASYQGSAKSRSEAGHYNVAAAMVKPVTKRKLVHSVKPEYPEWAKKRGIEAIVVLRFSVLADGTVSDKMYPVQTSGFHKLDMVAAHALKQWRFNAIEGSDTAVEQWGQVAFHFKL